MAMAQNRVIGKNNQLPWHLPDDLKHFKALTQGHPVIMGRKTHESIGRPLPGRPNLVVSRDGAYRSPFENAQSVETFTSIEAAIEKCSGKTDEVFIIGGAEIYRVAMPFVQRLYVTMIHREYDGDAKLPSWPADFKESGRRDCLEHEIPHSYLILDRAV